MRPYSFGVKVCDFFCICKRIGQKISIKDDCFQRARVLLLIRGGMVCAIRDILPIFAEKYRAMEYIHMNGLLIGIITFLIIGLFHPLVIKAEYYWGTGCWWIFLLTGIAGTAVSLFIENIFVSAICGVFAFSSFWAIKEIFEQKERVLKGWFPANPKRKYKD
jgi:hypothetical protein